jgi:hypothetical protein
VGGVGKGKGISMVGESREIRRGRKGDEDEDRFGGEMYVRVMPSSSADLMRA